MLGDSVKRRRRAVRASPPNRAPRVSGAGWRKVGLVFAALALPFLFGYVLAVLVLFPPTEVAGQGIAVPSLAGKTVSEAQSELTDAGLGALEITRLPHPMAAEGTVTAQSPLAGQHLRPGERVRAAVSGGVPRVSVPDVVDFPADRAAALLTRLGFRVLRNDEPAEGEPGRVIRQDPVPGTVVAVPARVIIWVSTSPPPALEADTGAVVRQVSRAAVRSDTDNRWPGPARPSTFESAIVNGLPDPERPEP